MYASTMVEYKDRLALAMKLNGVDEHKLKKALGISYQAVRKVLDGKSASFSALNNSKAAIFLQVNPFWLIEGVGEHGFPYRHKDSGASGTLLNKHHVFEEVISKFLVAHGEKLTSEINSVIKEGVVNIMSRLRIDIRENGDASIYSDAALNNGLQGAQKPKKQKNSLITRGRGSEVVRITDNHGYVKTRTIKPKAQIKSKKQS
jgi:hypothetical protein